MQAIEIQPAAPVVWDSLWSAMKEAPREWIETTEQMYDAMLVCVPPRAMQQNQFLVGEADHDDETTGKPVYACFWNRGGRFFARYLTLHQFNNFRIA